MLSLLKCKCLFGFLWTSAIAAGLLTIIFFSFINPLAIANLLALEIDTAMFSVKAYVSIFIFFWFTLNTSTYLAFYFGQLIKKMEQEEQNQHNKEIESTSDTHPELN